MLERDARRVAHVAEHVRKMLPGCVRLRAVDGMVEGELEGHCERHASEPRIDARGWAKRAACDGLSGAALTSVQRHSIRYDMWGFRFSKLATWKGKFPNVSSRFGGRE